MFTIYQHRTVTALLRSFPGRKLLNMLVLISLLLASCVPQSTLTPQAASKPAISLGILGSKSIYEPPVLTHSEPVMGEHVQIQASTEAGPDINKLPIQFIENVGQFDERASYQVQAGQQTTFLSEDEIWITILEDKKAVSPENIENEESLIFQPEDSLLRVDEAIKGVNLKLTFVGANPDIAMKGFSPLETTVSYLQNNGNSHASVPVWGGIQYGNIYPGYNLELTGGSDAGFSWHFVQTNQNGNSGSNLGDQLKEVRIKIEGAQSLVVDGNKVLITTEVGHLLLPLPDYNQLLANGAVKPYIDGTDVVISFPSSVSYEKGAKYAVEVEDPIVSLSPMHNRYAYQSNTNSSSAPLLTVNNDYITNNSGYISFLEAIGWDHITDIAVNPLGNAYITGHTNSYNFPTTPGSFQTDQAAIGYDAFIAKLTTDGSDLIYSTYIGGSSTDEGFAIGLDAEGNAVVVGRTVSSDFPMTSGAFDTTIGGTSDAFVVRINSDGSDLLNSTYIGGSDTEIGLGMALDPTDNVYMTGKSGTDIFVAKFDLDNDDLIYSTNFGGSEAEFVSSIVVDMEGYSYIVGNTASDDFSGATNTYDNSLSGSYDAFIAKINPSGTAIVTWTYLGGSSWDDARDIVLDTNGYIYIGGSTSSSSGFPTSSNAYDSTFNGARDGFVVKFDSEISELLYSTYIGGSSWDDITDIVLGEDQKIHLTGDTWGNFPLTSDAFDSSRDTVSNTEVFLSTLSINTINTDLFFSSYIGFNVIDFNVLDSKYKNSTGIAVDHFNNVYVVGYTESIACVDCYTEPSTAPENSFIVKFGSDGNPVYEASVLNSCNISGECHHPAQSANGSAGGPINTRTGNLYYQTEDISLQTSAGDLSFFRSYSSGATDLYTTSLGYGWTNNLDTRLIFPEDPGGEEGYVLFKAHTANLYQFLDNGDDTYTSQPGVPEELTFADDEFVITYPDQSVYTFDSDGVLQTWADSLGHTWEYTYDDGKLEQVSADDDTRFLAFTYDTEDRIETVEDHTERTITFTYDVNGDLVSATSLGGGAWQYEYDAAHRLTRVIDPMGNTDEHTEYDVQGRAIRQWDGLENLVVELTYNSDGTTTIVDGLENEQVHAYDLRNTLTENTNGVGATTDKTYDKNFHPEMITDADGDTTTLTWSADGANLLGVLDADGNETSITYDSLNNPDTVVDSLNHLTDYDFTGNLLTGITNALAEETTYTYTSEGYLETVTDPLENVTTYTYDSHGQRTSMTDALENTWEYEYDSLGRLVNVRDPLERVTHTEYDTAGRAVSVTRNYDTSHDPNEENIWNITTTYEYDLAGNQITVTDALDRTWRYEYDETGKLIKVIDPDENEMVNTYDDTGRLISTMDALEHDTIYTYDDAGRLIATIDELDNSVGTIYNLDGTVASTSDALERTTSYTYDDLKRVLTVTQPGGGITHNTYDDAGNLISTEDPLGNITQYEYDALGRVIKVIDPEENETETFYDEAGRVWQVVDPRDNHTTFTYDDAGRQIGVTDELGNITEYEYDDIGRRIAVVDANENRTEYTYDLLDRVVSMSNVYGETETVYDALGQVLSTTDANENTTTYTYDNFGRVLTQTDPMNGQTTFTYDDGGNRLTVQDANFHTSYMEYDELNRLVLFRDAEENETTTVYDEAGQVIASIDALEKTTYFEYNALGLQIEVIDPLENSTHYTYNAGGQLIAMLDANEVATSYEYYTTGRLKAVVENYKPTFTPTVDINVRTEYTYDENGNRLTIIDGNGNPTTFTYDELNRLLTESDALENTWTYGYDDVGNRISMIDANGQVTEYDYNNVNQLAAIDYAGSGPDVSFTYDAGGRRTDMVDSVGTTHWTYDALNRATEITDPFDRLVRYGYDAVGNRTHIIDPGKIVAYYYDANNRLTEVEDSSRWTHYGYDALGRVESMLRPNGVDTRYTYDDSSRLLEIKHATDASTLASYEYDYDAVGNRIQAVENVQIAGAGPTIHLTVLNTIGLMETGKEVYVYDGETDTGFHQTTDQNGQVAITLPEGNYRFRVDVDGTQFWSNAENHCTIGECDNLLMVVPTLVTALVADSDGAPIEGIDVYAYEGSTYSGYHGVTDQFGELMMRLPEGSFNLRVNYNGTEFSSENPCVVPGCGLHIVTVNLPVTVTVLDNLSMPHEGVEVYVFDGETYTDYHATTDENGQVQFTLPDGDYRFRADFNEGEYWSDAENHCAVPECRTATVNVLLPITVTVMDTNSAPVEGLTVEVYDDTSYAGFSDVTDEDGRVFFANLPEGDYRFRTEYNSVEFWSDTENHCSIPECSGGQITVTASPPTATPTVLPSTTPTSTMEPTETPTSTPEPSATPTEVVFFQPQLVSSLTGSLVQFLVGSSPLRVVPPRPQAEPPNDVSVTVLDTEDTPQEGLTVYAFDGETYTGFSEVSDSSGEVLFTLVDGSYRFSTDLNGTVFWSDDENHCTVPGCDAAEIIVTIPVTVTVDNTDDILQEGLNVQVYDEGTDTGFSGVTDENGEVIFTLPQGSYRFRTELNETVFWSDDENDCTVPGCEQSSVTVTIPLTITVEDTDESPKEGVEVYAFDGETFTGYQGMTDSNGEAIITLPLGSYRFRVDIQGTQFWSDDENHCTVAGCEEASITVNKPVVITVLDQNSDPYVGFSVHAFEGESITGYYAITNASGQASMVLPDGEYRFRADLHGTAFWSGAENHCGMPGCETASIGIPGGFEQSEVTINYTYDPLYRLERADSSTGDLYEYSYDAVGNRVGKDRLINGVWTLDVYEYDDANRLTYANEVPYTWDNNGNLLDDDNNTYTYDTANRLTDISDSIFYTYNGLGDRIQQSVDSETTNYLLDINSGLTQVLNDGTTSYTYGLGRISQQNGLAPEYFLGDALGSVRQLTDQSSAITAWKSYDPYGSVVSEYGTSASAYGYTGEAQDYNGMVYLRARYYNPYLNQFIQPDTIVPDPRTPADWNRYAYVRNNPINYTDHSGQTVDTQPSDCLWGYIIGTGGVIICNVFTYSHHYVISTEVCPFYLHCKKEEMVDYMSRFAFPGQFWWKPALDRDFDAVAPFRFMPKCGDKKDCIGYETGAIQLFVRDGGLTTQNNTLPTHIFHEGNVIRKGSQGWSGAWRVDTDGKGTNSSAQVALTNQFAGRQIFVEVDEMMKVYIISKKVPAHLRSLGDLLINFQCEIKEYQSSQ